jgi:Dyggve-Melchior-Clausen syndrome protein
MEDVQKAYHGHLTRFSSSCRQPADSPFWLQLTRISGVSLAVVEPSLLFTFLEPFAVQLAKNNTITGHFALLVAHSVGAVGSASSVSSQASARDVVVASNCILLLRSLTVALLREIPPYSHRSILLASFGQDASQDVLYQLVSTCLAYVEQADLSSHTYSLYYACLTMLSACCSSSLYHAEDSGAGVCYVPFGIMLRRSVTSAAACQ